MILILSEDNDVSTNKVAGWLYHYRVPFLRINDSGNVDIVKHITMSCNQCEIVFSYNNREYRLSDFHAIWHRRGFYSFSLPDVTCTNLESQRALHRVKNHLDEEVRTLFDYLCYKSGEITHVNDLREYNANKLITLDKAVKAGLKIPVTHIAKDLKRLFRNNDEYITKSIQDGLSYWDEEVNFSQYCEKLEPDKSAPDSFFYSLFQEKISKH